MLDWSVLRYVALPSSRVRSQCLAKSRRSGLEREWGLSGSGIGCRGAGAQNERGRSNDVVQGSGRLVTHEAEAAWQCEQKGGRMDWPGYGIAERMYGQDARGADDGDGNGSQTRAPGGSKLGVTTKAMILTCQSYHMSPAIHPQSTPPTLAWQRKRDDKARRPVRHEGLRPGAVSFFLTYILHVYTQSTMSPRLRCSAPLRVGIKPHYPILGQAGDYLYTLAAGHMA